MSELLIPKCWTDFIDEDKYQLTGEALLYRNPHKETNTGNGIVSISPNYEFSTSPGNNYIFDQKPIAYGFTAYIGHDEVMPGYNSLKSNIVVKRVFQTEDYYRNYLKKIYDLELLRNNMKARPKSIKDFEVSFYSGLLIKEEEKLKLSERFFTECVDEDGTILKELLNEYIEAFLEGVQKKIYELNPRENQINGFGGFSPKDATILFEHFKGRYIHSMSSKRNFIAIFQTNKLPNGWSRVEWTGFKADLFSFMDQIFGSQVHANTIKKYFKVEGDNLLSHHRLTKSNFSLKNILDSSKY